MHRTRRSSDGSGGRSGRRSTRRASASRCEYARASAADASSAAPASSRRVVADQESPVRCDRTMAPTTPSSDVSGAASVRRRPYTRRTRAAIRSATCCGSRPRALGGTPRPGVVAFGAVAPPPRRPARSARARPPRPIRASTRARVVSAPTAAGGSLAAITATPTAERWMARVSKTGSSRSVIGRSVLESATPGAGADQRGVEDPGVGPPPDHDDVVGVRGSRELVDDGAQDRVGGDRA